MSRTHEEIAQTIRALIAEQIHKDTDFITPKSSLESLGADSLDQVEIIIKLQEEFGIEIDDASAEKIKTVQEAIDYIASRVG